ncbi:MAG: hypothetical protein E7458_00385 [Ruminococcaceae bacterium]|nr:hypothetical protein [Oscillospiraceae bacterium]
MDHNISVRVDAGKWLGTLAHTWNYVGYDECNYTHSPGGMALIEKFGKLEKPYYMRAHHMLCTGIMHGFYKWGSTNVYTEDEQGNPVYYYDCIDRMMDIWLQANCKPFFEIGFMPKDLADTRAAEDPARGYSMDSYRRTGWAMPPKDYDRWYELIVNLTQHLLDRYGAEELKTWYFELWNEPDIFYWRGTPEEYHKLYDYTEAAIHAVLPEARFGGPATTGNETLGEAGALFLENFLKHTKSGTNYYSGKTGTRVDFTSFHTKGGLYDMNLLAKKQIPSVKVLVNNAKTQSTVIREAGYGDLECVMSETDPDAWAAGGRFDNFNLNFRNTEYYASFVASGYKHLYDLAERIGMDLRPLAWAFMFEGERCFEGTRTFSTQGIDKPVMNLFKLYSKLGTQRVALESSRAMEPLEYQDNNGTAEGPEIDGWATVGKDDSVQILLFAHHDDWDVRENFDVTLSLAGLPKGAVTVKHYRIDEEHSNACTEWKRQGMPDWPNEGQYAAIKARDGIELLSAPETIETDGEASLSFSMPSHAVSLILIEKA